MTSLRIVMKATKRSMLEKKKLYVGIDPGTQGAVGLITGKYAYALSLPTTKVKRGKRNRNEFVLSEIVSWFKRLSAFKYDGYGISVILERPLAMGGTYGGGRGGIYSAMIQGENFGMWPLFLTSLELVPTIVVPHVWKKAMGLTKVKDKSREMAMKLFPNLDFKFKKDHDKAEAVLMAEYLRRKTRAARMLK